MTKKEPPLKFEYTNWEGKTATRTVQPIKIWYGETQYHKGPHWFLKAVDVEKNAERDFAIIDILKFLK